MRIITIVAVAVLPVSSAADAQQRFDVYGGGQFVHRSPAPIARAWLATGGFRVNEMFDYLVEVGWYQREDHYFQVATGVRGRLTRERRVTPFYQGLVGLFIFSPRTENRLVALSPWDADAPFVLQPGGGLDVVIRPGLKVRLAADLVMVVFESETHNAARASIGIAAQF